MRPGKSDVERPELLGDDERRVVGQHDAAGADPDRRRAAGHMGDDDRRRRAGDAGHVVMLGQPVAVIAPALGVLREVERVAERLRGGAARAIGREIEDGEGRHVHYVTSGGCVMVPDLQVLGRISPILRHEVQEFQMRFTASTRCWLSSRSSRPQFPSRSAQRRRTDRPRRGMSSSSASTVFRLGRSDDPFLPVPTLRALAARGAVAAACSR